VLANEFMSAADLELTQSQHDALVTTLTFFEAGKVRHVREEEYDEWETIEDSDFQDAAFSGLFNMSMWEADDAPYTCGTIACIGGTAELLGKVEFDGWNCHPGLEPLFSPKTDLVGDWDEITVERAAQAFRGFLTTGTADWSVFVP
jgi:hypothetical protein